LNEVKPYLSILAYSIGLYALFDEASSWL